MKLMLGIKQKFKNNKFLLDCYESFDKQLRKILYSISPTVLANYVFLKHKKSFLNLRTPKSFDEKLIWLMLYWRHPLKIKCADKFSVRAYVKLHGFEHTLTDLLGVYNNSSEIDFSTLPNSFVLKCTHSSGHNIITTNKSELNIEATKRKLDLWLKTDISKIAGEIHYSNITPRIICEKYLDDGTGDVPIDYKVYCFDGKAHCTMVCLDRGVGGRPKFFFYDRDWKKRLPYSKTSLNDERSIPKPHAYEKIIYASEVLSKPFKFVRMDFFSIKGKVIFGEMTFTPNGCVDTDIPDLAQKELGDLLNLGSYKKFKG